MVSASSSLKNTLESIASQTTNLIELCDALKEQNDLLSLENDSLSVALDASEAGRKKLEEKLAAARLAIMVGASSDALASPVGPRVSLEGGPAEKNLDIKQKINEFVREIDKCITLLNK